MMGFPGVAPYRRSNEFAITVEGYIPLVEKEYDTIAASKPFFAKQVAKTSFVYYCVQHLYARLITIKRARGESTYNEDAYSDQVLSGNHSIPSPIESYLKAIGNVVDPSQLRYNLMLPAWPQEDGTFGRVSSTTHWKYMTLPCPQIVAERIQQDMKVTAVSGVRDWNLKDTLKPTEASAGLPTRNCLGWARAATLTNDQVSFLEGAGIMEDQFPTKLLKEKQDQMTTFSFDCQKNLALPKVPDQSCYYSRQLYLYNFTIVQGSSKDPLNVNTTFAYIWTENEFAKAANQIASAVYDRLNKTDFTGISHIRLVADGCSGQNKNSTMLAMCCRWLLDNRHIKKIELVFPITGHSFMPPDRVFGNIEKKIRKKEVIVKPEEYIDFISEHATVTSLSNILVYDWKTSVQNTVKAPAQLHFKITQCKRFILRRSKKIDNVLVRGELFYNSDTGNPKSICKAGKNAEMIKPILISKGLAVNKLKLKDVKNLLKKHYGEDWNVRPELEFYEKVISGPECEEEEREDTELCEMRDLDIGLRV